MKMEITAKDVVDLLRLFAEHEIPVHLDGGWGVDALLGEQTRPHADLDIAVQHKDVPKLRELLQSRDFREVPRDDSWECNFVLANAAGHEVDVHSYAFDEKGEVIYGVPYPADSLTGVGVIDGYEVNCISAEWMVAFHSGYELDQSDYADVSALCERFGIDLRSEFCGFEPER